MDEQVLPGNNLEHLDHKLAEQYGDYAGYETGHSPTLETYGNNPHQEIKRLLKQLTTRESHILDLGCGAGQTLCQFAPHVAAAWGFDQEQNLLDGAQHRAQNHGLTNVTFVAGNAANPEDVTKLPNTYFDLIFSERGPNMNQSLINKLKPGGYILQELVGGYDGFHLREILGRRPFTVYAYRSQTDQMLANMAELNLRPISIREFFYDAFFQDVDHLHAYLTQVSASLNNWRIAPKPYDPTEDYEELILFARYNTTPRGIRLLQHRLIFVWLHTPIHYYPIEGYPGR